VVWLRKIIASLDHRDTLSRKIRAMVDRLINLLLPFKVVLVAYNQDPWCYIKDNSVTINIFSEIHFLYVSCIYIKKSTLTLHYSCAFLL